MKGEKLTKLMYSYNLQKRKILFKKNSMSNSGGKKHKKFKIKKRRKFTLKNETKLQQKF